MKTPLKINTDGGTLDVLPSLENCLRDNTGNFYSTQNAIRLHEWLGGTSTDPLVLEAVKPDESGVVHTRRLGHPSVAAYPERLTNGDFLKLEQAILASKRIGEMMGEALESAIRQKDDMHTTAASETVQALWAKLNPIMAFNASNLYFGYEMPQRFVMESLEVIDILFTCVLTQRKRKVYKTDATWPSEIPLNLYSQRDFDSVIICIHRGESEGFMINPAVAVKQNHLLDENFFRQCAMAMSSCCNIPILTDYVAEKPDQTYFWAVSVLMSVRDSLDELRVRPKPTVVDSSKVVSLFQKPKA